MLYIWMWKEERVMKISTKGRYALRLMLDIAVNDNGTPVRIKDISARQEISDKYLEQIISILNKAGYVKSIRGSQGGYLLAKKPEEYTAGMILRLTEGSLAPVSCLEFEKNDCPRQNECVTLQLWKTLNEAIKGVVDKVTLADLVKWQMQKADDYVI
jgi:Rrf2 family protein